MLGIENSTGKHHFWSFSEKKIACDLVQWIVYYKINSISSLFALSDWLMLSITGSDKIINMTSFGHYISNEIHSYCSEISWWNNLWMWMYGKMNWKKKYRKKKKINKETWNCANKINCVYLVSAAILVV